MLALYLHVMNWLNEDRGQDLIEYALLAALIAVVAIVAIRAVGQAIPGIFNQVTDELGGAAP